MRRICYSKIVTGSNDVFAVRFQGMQSYTMQGGSTIVQFRHEPFELAMHEKAMTIHKGYVLPMTCKQTTPFYVYVFLYGGRPCCASEFQFNLERKKKGIRDVALFLAQSCEHPGSV